MSFRQTTLFSYLTQKNPELDAENVGDGGTTITKAGDVEIPTKLEKWEDFDPQCLAKIFNGELNNILSMDVECREPSIIPSLPFCEIHDEDSLEGLLTLWNQQIVSAALEEAQKHINVSSSSARVFMVRGGQAQRVKSLPINSKPLPINEIPLPSEDKSVPSKDKSLLSKDRKRKTTYPDWAAIKRKVDQENLPMKRNNILPGDTKLAKKWRYTEANLGPMRENPADWPWLRPIVQVYTYCVRLNARYGYIITDEELVVMRIHVDSKGDSQASAEAQDSQGDYEPAAQQRARKESTVQLRSIPWSNHVDDMQLNYPWTVNLALFCLHLLAAVDSHIEWEYDALSNIRLPETKRQTRSFTSMTTAAIGNIALSPATSFSGYAEQASQNSKKRTLDDAVQSQPKISKKR